jgi:hypothetical protein
MAAAEVDDDVAECPGRAGQRGGGEKRQQERRERQQERP